MDTHPPMRPCESFESLPAIIAFVDAQIRASLPEKRAEHCRRTAARAGELCIAYGMNPALGTLAGLAHDMCRALSLAQQWELARRLEKRPGAMFWTESLRDSPDFADKIVHGPASAERIAEILGQSLPEAELRQLMEAISLHTLGDPAMGKLAAILYIADKTEPGRGRSTTESGAAAELGAATEPGAALPPLRLLLAETVESTIAWLHAKDAAVAERSKALYNALTTELKADYP